MKHTLRLLTVLAMLIGCGDDDTGSTDAAIDTSADATTDGMTAEDTDLPPIPDEYEFTRNGESSVAYTGQIMRHVLIADLKRHLDGISDGIDSGSYPTSAMPLVETEEGRVVAALDFYFRFDEANADVEHGFVTDPAVFETTYGDISTKNLVDKLAGNDTSTDHRDWSTAFSGWADDSIAASGGGVDSPENLIVAFFETLEANALARVDGTTRRGPGTNGTTVGDGDILPVFLLENGVDLQQMIDKLLRTGIAYSQATDDYLDDDVEGKGLLASHDVGDDPYTSREHAWDEAFGYFGLSVYTSQFADDDAIADDKVVDGDGDGRISLISEYMHHAAVNAAKRDRASASSAPTDFTADAWEAFIAGRHLLATTEGELSEADAAALRGYRDTIVMTWEMVIAATVVHYINDTLRDMNTIGTDAYSFAGHAKHWSELKGFALGLQFNPHALLSAANFTTFHELVGDAPVLGTAPAADLEAYRADLRAARGLLAAAYGFDAANVGDDAGENGW